MSAVFADLDGTGAGALTAGGAGLGGGATEEISQPAGGGGKAAMKNRLVRLFMINPLGMRWPGAGMRAALMAESSTVFPRASETVNEAGYNRPDTIRFGTSRRPSEFWRDRPCRRERGREDY